MVGGSQRCSSPGVLNGLELALHANNLKPILTPMCKAPIWFELPMSLYRNTQLKSLLFMPISVAFWQVTNVLFGTLFGDFCHNFYPLNVQGSGMLKTLWQLHLWRVDHFREFVWCGKLGHHGFMSFTLLPSDVVSADCNAISLHEAM